jgi:hypothetical protein
MELQTLDNYCLQLSESVYQMVVNSLINVSVKILIGSIL